MWPLDDNGFGNEYYSAGVRSMIAGWRNFFFNAFDPAGFVSLDKPPVAFWIQAASAKLFGFRALSLLLPQVVEGLAAILVLHHLVARRFGAAAGLLAAAFLALTPVSVAVDRSTNTESCLVLVLLLSAWALSLAGERGSWRHLALAMALLGVGFNVKMLAALVVAPGMLLVYLLGAPMALGRRLRHAVLGLAVLGAVALSWSAVYDLTPSERRPFAGSSHGNSMIELAVDHNGLQRFVRNRPSPPMRRAGTNRDAAPGSLDSVPTGPLRLADPDLAGQFAWLLPIAVLGLVLARRRGAASLALWGVLDGDLRNWSSARPAASSTSTICRLFAPPLAALAGIGFVELWRRNPSILALGLGAAALWQAYVLAGPFGWGTSWIAAPGIALLAAIAVALRGKRRPAFVGAAALLVLPVAWALSALLPG